MKEFRFPETIPGAELGATVIAQMGLIIIVIFLVELSSRLESDLTFQRSECLNLEPRLIFIDFFIILEPELGD